MSMQVNMPGIVQLHFDWSKTWYLMQFESDKAAGSHSHRGLSPVDKVTPFLSEPFQRFRAAIRRTSKRETVETVGSISRGLL